VRIVESAHRHGVGDDAILAALAVPMRRVHLDDDLLLVIGADATAQLLELVVAGPDTDDARVIHAMPLRRKFYRYL